MSTKSVIYQVNIHDIKRMIIKLNKSPEVEFSKCCKQNVESKFRTRKDLLVNGIKIS